MNTGEDAQALRKIMDMTRLISITILAIHFYICCYYAFAGWHLAAPIVTHIADNIARTGLFNTALRAKAAAMLALVISLIGTQGRKDEKIGYRNSIIFLLSGLLIYFLSNVMLSMHGGSLSALAIAYMGFTAMGYVLVLTGAGQLSRVIRNKLNHDVFNSENETFPQEERLLQNEFSINLRAKYQLKGRMRNSWINIINPFRGVLVAGTPGAGKSYFVIRHVIDQHLKKGFSMFLYDFKWDDLTRIVYNKLYQYQGSYPVKPTFYMINFDDLDRSHRCNPLYPESMEDITDAMESSRTIMLGLNRDWIRKQGDFFVESAINLLAALIWFLRKYDDGKYCTLPHVIELMQVDYEHLFPVLNQETEIQALISPFISAYLSDTSAQLEGQVASTKIALGRLASPQLYYVLSGNDFTLDVNDPQKPKIVCMGNNPQKLQTYGAVLSLYISRMIKLVNRKGQLKSSLIFDEFPTIYFNNIDSLIATARSNKVSTTLAVQDFSQLTKDYGKEQAEVITGIVGNIISGQVMGQTAKTLSENIGKIVQDRSSMNINSSDTSITRSTQLDYAVPASKIAALSSGEFVGTVADNPDQRISLKKFHCAIQNDDDAIAKEQAAYRALPVIRSVTPDDIQANYEHIRNDIASMIREEIEKLKPRPSRKRRKKDDDEGGDDDSSPAISM